MATATSRSRERARSAEHNLPVPLTSLIRPHARAASGWRDAPPDASGDADRPGRGREDAPRGELARRQLPRRADGVWLVDLAAGPETPDVAAETARVLDVRTLRRTTDRAELDTFPRPGRRSLHRDSAVRFRSDGGPARVSRRKRLRRPGAAFRFPDGAIRDGDGPRPRRRSSACAHPSAPARGLPSSGGGSRCASRREMANARRRRGGDGRAGPASSVPKRLGRGRAHRVDPSSGPELPRLHPARTRARPGGKAPWSQRPKSLLYISMLFREHADTIAAASAPQRAMMAAMAAVGRLLGLELPPRRS